MAALFRGIRSSLAPFCNPSIETNRFYNQLVPRLWSQVLYEGCSCSLGKYSFRLIAFTSIIIGNKPYLTSSVRSWAEGSQQATLAASSLSWNTCSSMKQAHFQQGPSGITRADTAIHPIHTKNDSDLNDDDATTLDTSSLDIDFAVTDITGAGLIPVLFS